MYIGMFTQSGCNVRLGVSFDKDFYAGGQLKLSANAKPKAVA